MTCKSCPLRLFNKHHNLQGIGNPHIGRVIVLFDADYDAVKEGNMGCSKQVEVIQSIIPSTGGLDSDYYIIPLIRCHTNDDCELNEDIVSNCIKHFKSDATKYNWLDIMLCGRSAEWLINKSVARNLNKLFLTPSRRKITVNYSPLIKYTSDAKFEIFKERLTHWYNCSRAGLYDYVLYML